MRPNIFSSRPSKEDIVETKQQIRAKSSVLDIEVIQIYTSTCIYTCPSLTLLLHFDLMLFEDCLKQQFPIYDCFMFLPFTLRLYMLTKYQIQTSTRSFKILNLLAFLAERVLCFLVTFFEAGLFKAHLRLVKISFSSVAQESKWLSNVEYFIFKNMLGHFIWIQRSEPENTNTDSDPDT